MSLQDHCVVVTGGTRGLGLALAEGFLEQGASVVCGARTPAGIEDLVARAPDRVVFHHTDVTNENSVRSLMDRAVKEYDRLDVLVCNAGICLDGKISRLNLADWTATVATNLTGTFLCVQAAVEPMTAAGGGRIITVSSSLASRVAIGAAAYSASKAAVEMFTRSAAAELATRGITVNCLAPGYFGAGMGARFVDNPRLWEKHPSHPYLGRLGDAAELMAAALFLASPASSYVNGHVLEVNGGLH